MVAQILGRHDDTTSLREALAAAAHRASDAQVVVYAAAGIAIGTCAIIVRPMAWMAFTGIGACIAAFGLWAIADRELGDGRSDGSRASRIAWRVLRTAAAVVGTAGAVLMLFLLLGLGLGTWTS